MTLAELLNKYNAGASVVKGTLEVQLVPGDEFLTLDGTVPEDSELDQLLDRLEVAEKYLDDHAMGRDGGYVPWVHSNGESSWYDQNGDCCWKD